MEFSNKDFNADKVKMYEEVRKSMVRNLCGETVILWAKCNGGSVTRGCQDRIVNLYDCQSTAMQCHRYGQEYT